MKVSIIIPTYNYGEYLEQCLNSVLEQTYQNWEAWVIDDGSTDSTESLVKSYRLNDPRINYHYQSNQGLSKARNKGLELSSGEFIQFLDADDKLSKEKLTLQIQHFKEHPTMDISYCQTYFFAHHQPDRRFEDILLQNRSSFPKIEGPGPRILQVLIKANFTVVSSPLIRKSEKTASIRFKETIKNSEDWYFWLECALMGCHFSFLTHTDAHTLIRVHPDSMSHKKFLMYYGELQLRDWLEKQLNTSGLKKAEKEFLFLQNQITKDKLIKHAMLTGPLWNLSHLKVMYRHTGLSNLLRFHKEARKHQKSFIYQQKNQSK